MAGTLSVAHSRLPELCTVQHSRTKEVELGGTYLDCRGRLGSGSNSNLCPNQGMVSPAQSNVAVGIGGGTLGWEGLNFGAQLHNYQVKSADNRAPNSK